MRPNQMNVFEIKVYFSYNIVRILLESAKNGYYALVAPGALIWVNGAPSSGYFRELHSKCVKKWNPSETSVYF